MKTFGMKNRLGFLVVTLGLVLAVGQAGAGLISSREALDAILADSVIETFETYPVTHPAGRDLLGETNLNAGTDVLGTGAGQVVEGVTFRSGDRTPGKVDGDVTQIQWNSTAGGLPESFTQTISSNYSSRIIEIVFDEAMYAFGVDVGTYGYNYSDYVTVKVFGDGEDPLYSWNDQYIASASKYFFGYEFDDNESGVGIRRVEISGSEHEWSPLIDNVQFGTTAVPEPGAAYLLGTGLVYLVGFRRKWRKK